MTLHAPRAESGQPRVAHADAPGRRSAGSVVWYDLLDRGGKAPLPLQPDVFPWPGPLQGRAGELSGGVFTAAALSFAIVELN